MYFILHHCISYCKLPRVHFQKGEACNSSSGLSYQWNHLNLIKNISEPDMCLVNYSYLADGTKFSALDDDGAGFISKSLQQPCTGSESCRCSL